MDVGGGGSGAGIECVARGRPSTCARSVVHRRRSSDRITGGARRCAASLSTPSPSHGAHHVAAKNDSDENPLHRPLSGVTVPCSPSATAPSSASSDPPPTPPRSKSAPPPAAPIDSTPPRHVLPSSAVSTLPRQRSTTSGPASSSSRPLRRLQEASKNPFSTRELRRACMRAGLSSNGSKAVLMMRLDSNFLATVVPPALPSGCATSPAPTPSTSGLLPGASSQDPPPGRTSH